jgi:hypothetical protein
MTLPVSCSINNYFSTTSLDWGKFGVGFISNLCKLVTESFIRGLQNLHPPVQIWVLPLDSVNPLGMSRGFSALFRRLADEIAIEP